MPTPRQGYRNKAGDLIPGCTTVLKALSSGNDDALLYWAAKLAKAGLDWKEERQRAADTGSFIHDCLERVATVMPERPLWMNNEEWQKAQDARAHYLAWFLAVNPKIIAQEVQLVSEEHQAGGTFDVLYAIGKSGEKVIADHKTGKVIDLPKVAAQMAFYAAAIKENMGHEVKRGLILHYTAKGLRPIEVNETQMRYGLELFRTARAAYSLFKTFPRAMA